MHELYKLKEMLMKELEEYGKAGEMTAGSLDVVDKLSHTIKNLCKIIESSEEEEYSMDYRGGDSYDGEEGRMPRRGGSYARGRGRNARRDSMGRYSRAGAEDMVEELRELMQEAPDDKTRMEFQKFITKLEQM